MGIKLILSPPASGKTAACIERIKTVQQGNPLAKVWVIVPNAQKAAYFKSRLAKAGGAMSVKVGNFRAFYQEVLEESSHFVPVITPALSNRLIQETVDQVYAAGKLSHYASIKSKLGFLSLLKMPSPNFAAQWSNRKIFLNTRGIILLLNTNLRHCMNIS